MAARLRVLGVGATTEKGIEAGVFCEAGTVSVGDRVTSATMPSGERVQVDLEIAEIRLFDQRVDELAEVYSGNVVFAAGPGASIEEGSLLESAPPAGSTA